MFIERFHFRHGGRALALTVSGLALALFAPCAMAQQVKTEASPDLPAVEVPQEVPQAAAAQKPKAKKPKVQAAAKPKKASPAAAPEPETVAAPAPEPESADPAVALGSYNPALATGDLVLPPGTTLTTAGPVDGYRALTAMSSTKTATPIEQIPRSIQVVPKKVLEDQNSLTVEEAVRNVSGCRPRTACRHLPTSRPVFAALLPSNGWME
jgi:iron complex outermembrane receptor protein